MQLVDIIGWIGNAGFIVGSYLIAKKRIEGFYAFGLGNALYIILGIILNTSSVWAISIYLLVMNLYGIIHWRKNNEK